MENVLNIANWFLSKSDMTHKRVQKLCYYAQAWYCALYDGTPLFEDEIQAWIHGPVITSLYPIFADYKWSLIPKTDFDESIFSDDVLDILEAVYNTYGGFSDNQLENLSHTEEPWINARAGAKPWEVCTNPIPCFSMRYYYSKKYEQAQND